MWMNLGNLLLSEISQAQRQIPCDPPRVGNLKDWKSQKQRKRWLPGLGMVGNGEMLVTGHGVRPGGLVYKMDFKNQSKI